MVLNSDWKAQLLKETKILFVDDDPTLRWLVRKAFLNMYQFSFASTLQIARDVYDLWHPDIIFLDLSLPDGCGFDVMEEILEENPAAQVVIISNNSSPENIHKARMHGAKGFLLKPFSKEKMLEFLPV